MSSYSLGSSDLNGFDSPRSNIDTWRSNLSILNRLRDRFVILEDNVISDLESMQVNIEEVEDNMKSVKQEILNELSPIINGLLEENASLRSQVTVLNKNMMMFRDKLNVPDDEPYDTDYDYAEIKTRREELHKEFKTIYRFFKKSIIQTYTPIAVVIAPKQI